MEKKRREEKEDFKIKREQKDLIKNRWDEIGGENLLFYLRANNQDVKCSKGAYYFVDNNTNCYRLVYDGYSAFYNPYFEVADIQKKLIMVCNSITVIESISRYENISIPDLLTKIEAFLKKKSNNSI